MAQVRYECSQCDKVSCNRAAADQHNRDMHGSCADVFPLRSRRELLAEIARLKRDKDALHSTIENCVSAGASLQAALTAERENADRLADALHHMINASMHPDQMADEALAAHMKLRGK